MEDHPLYPFNLPGTTKNSVLKDRANLARLFVAVEDGGCAAYIYEVARVPDTPDYDFKKYHPRYWNELSHGQMHRLVFDLVHNNHPYIFLMTGGGGMCKWDFIANIPPPLEESKMHYMLFGHKRSGERCVVRVARAGVVVGVVKLSQVENCIVLQVDSLGGQTMYVGKLSAGRVWQTCEVENMLHKVLAMKGMISTRQSFKLLSGVAQEGGVPQVMWNPLSYLQHRVTKKRTLQGVNRATHLFEPVDENVIAAGTDQFPLTFLDVDAPMHAGSSDEESDSSEESPVPCDEDED